MQKAFFTRAEAKDAVHGVGGAVVGGVEVADLELAQEADAEHLDAGEDKDAGDDEDGAVLIEDVAVGEDLEDQHPDGEGAAGEHADGADGSEEVERAGHVLEQKPDGEEVEEDAEGAGDAVVTFAGGAGGIGDGDFADGGAVPAGKRWDEAMHLAIERYVLDNLAPVGLEGSAEVVNIDTGEDGHEFVGGARGGCGA